jgi:hypothetical protein
MIVLRRLSKSRGTRARVLVSLSMPAAHRMKQIFHIWKHKRFHIVILLVFNLLKLKGFEQISHVVARNSA